MSQHREVPEGHNIVESDKRITAQGQRKEPVGRLELALSNAKLSQPVVSLIEKFVTQIERQALLSDINRGPDIFMNRHSRQGEGFPKEIQSSVTANEANHMIFPFQWLRQSLNWGWLAGREAQWDLACSQTFQRSLASEFAVSIASIMQRLKLQRPLRKAAADFSSSLPRNF